MSTENTPRPGAAPAPADRRAFLRKAMLVGAAPAAVLATSGSATAQQGGTNQIQLGDVTTLFRREIFRIYGHERAHVSALLDVLGPDARPKPTFRNLVQPTFRGFRTIGRALENTGVGAYLGAAPAINDPDYLAAAGSIALIEARHAGVFNFLDRDPITANAEDTDADQDFDIPLTAARVGELAGPFIANLNGGPPLTYSTTPSDANDIAILNFALALEHLEADFYMVNLQKFYPGFFQMNPNP